MSFTVARNILGDEARKAAERHGLQLLTSDVGVVLVDEATDAFKVRFWKRAPGYTGTPYDAFRGWVLVDCETIMVVKTNPAALRDLYAQELDGAMEAYLLEYAKVHP